MRRLLILFWQTILIVSISNAGDFYNCTLHQQDSICYSVEFFKDSNDLSFEAIKNLPANTFREYQKEKLRKDSVYWFRIIVLNKNAAISAYFMHFNSMISFIELFQTISDSTYKMNVGGALMPLSKRTIGGYIKDKIPFTLSGSEKTVLYIRVLNQMEPEYDLDSIEILSKVQYEKTISDLNFLQACFLGMMIILMILNIILFGFSRNRLYLFYSLYILFTSLFFFNNFQFSERYLFFNHPKLDFSLYWAVFIAQIAYLLFFLELLKNENMAIWRKYVKYYAWFLFLIYSVILIIGQYDYSAAVIVSDFYTLLNVIFVVCSFFIFFKRVGITTKIVLIGSFIMVIGALITTIISFSHISISNIYYYQVGVIIELILFSIAVNYTYSKEYLEKVEVLYQNTLLKLEKNHKELENQTLKTEIDTKNRNLATKAMLLSEKEILISSLIQQLNEIDVGVKNKPAIQHLINNLKLNLSTNSWDEFEIHFNETHPQFYLSLNAKYPNLSSNDRKLCAFLKLNLSSKEIAVITGKSLNTIDVGRSRLRKKMGLDNEENLQTAIANISSL